MTKAEQLTALAAPLAADGNPFAAQILRRLWQANDPEAEAERIIEEIGALVRYLGKIGEKIQKAALEFLTELGRAMRERRSVAEVVSQPTIPMITINHVGQGRSDALADVVARQLNQLSARQRTR